MSEVIGDAVLMQACEYTPDLQARIERTDDPNVLARVLTLANCPVELAESHLHSRDRRVRAGALECIAGNGRGSRDAEPGADPDGIPACLRAIARERSITVLTTLASSPALGREVRQGVQERCGTLLAKRRTRTGLVEILECSGLRDEMRVQAGMILLERGWAREISLEMLGPGLSSIEARSRWVQALLRTLAGCANVRGWARTSRMLCDLLGDTCTRSVVDQPTQGVLIAHIDTCIRELRALANTSPAGPGQRRRVAALLEQIQTCEGCLEHQEGDRTRLRAGMHARARWESLTIAWAERTHAWGGSPSGEILPTYCERTPQSAPRSTQARLRRARAENSHPDASHIRGWAHDLLHHPSVPAALCVEFARTYARSGHRSGGGILERGLRGGADELLRAICLDENTPRGYLVRSGHGAGSVLPLVGWGGFDEPEAIRDEVLRGLHGGTLMALIRGGKIITENDLESLRWEALGHVLTQAGRGVSRLDPRLQHLTRIAARLQEQILGENTGAWEILTELSTSWEGSFRELCEASVDACADARVRNPRH